MSSTFPHLDPPGIVVNALKGDPHEHRAHRWLEWDGHGDLACALVGVPFDGASVVRTGSRHGPDAVRRALANYTTYSSSTGRLMSGMRTADVGDVRVVLTDMPGTFERIRETVASLIAAGTIPVIIGGDHSVTWPILEGVTGALSGRRVGIVHFDQHHDLREAHFGAESSGVPFRKALEFPGAPILPANLVQIGLGEFSNSPVHAAYAAEHGITVIPATQVFERGLDDVVTEALRAAGAGTDAVYVSVDIDVVDQSQAPGTAAPNPYGLDARDLARALRRIGATARVAGLDVVEISPELEPLNVTGNTGANLVLSFLAGCADRLDAAAPRG
jgi:formimidoylglutamase